MSDFEKHIETLNRIKSTIEKYGLVKTYGHCYDDEGIFGTYTFPDALGCSNGDVMKVESLLIRHKNNNIKEQLSVSFAAGCYADNFDVWHKVHVSFSMWRSINIDDGFEELCDLNITKLRNEFENAIGVCKENLKRYHMKQIVSAGEKYVV